MCKYYKILIGLAIILFPGLQVFAQNFNLDLRASMEFPNQKIAGLWGWVSPDNHEYALVGANNGMIIIDVTNPDSPEQIVTIPAPKNDWKEIRTYSHYAYMVTEGGGGVLIVDLSGLPATTLTYHSYTGDNNMSFTLGHIHSLHIDEKKGVLYLYGGAGGGATYYDLTQNAYEPAFLGSFNALGYVHDGYVDNDTMYACHVYSGIMSMVDLSDKSDPVVLGTVETPAKFAHNSWLLGDRKHVLVTDENKPSYVTCYNVSDPSDITETDRISVDLDSSLAHNVQVINDWAVVSWYTAGVVILDCHRPQNIIQTGHYDTWPGAGAGFIGCWSAYPFFPSGTIISGHIPNLFSSTGNGELFVFKPTYKRACYFEGKIRNTCTGAPIPDVSVEIIGGETLFNTKSDNNGNVFTGQSTPGQFTVRFKKPGLETYEMDVHLEPSEVFFFDIEMGASAYHEVSGKIRLSTGIPVANSIVYFNSEFESFVTTTNTNGEYTITCLPGGNYAIAGGKWGNGFSVGASIAADTTLDFITTNKYYDDFNANYGWTTLKEANKGHWTRTKPIMTANAPGTDGTEDLGGHCYVTGNSAVLNASDAVSWGYVTLISPPMDLTAFEDAILSFKYWFNKTGNVESDDYFEVAVTNGIGPKMVIFTDYVSGGWKSIDTINLKTHIELTNYVQVHFKVSEFENFNIAEGAVDQFLVTPESVSGTDIGPVGPQFLVSPNPSSDMFHLNYPFSGIQNPVFEIRNSLGQLVSQGILEKENTTLGMNLASGIYFLTVTSDGKPSKPIKLIKN